MTDHITGSLLGLAAGDRIGGPSNMALTLAECLAGHGTFDLGAIARSYFEWWRSDGYDSGPTSAQVFSFVSSGMSFEDAAKQVHKNMRGMTAGCNPAHRAAPLAMFMKVTDDELAAAAMAEARLTHLHPLAGDVSAAVVRLCRALIQGQPWANALRFAAIGRLPETTRALKMDHRQVNLASGFAPDVMAAAISFVDQADSFESALRESLDRDSGANYVPVLVGSIAGARWGRDSISITSRGDSRSILDRIEKVVERLSKSERNS